MSKLVITPVPRKVFKVVSASSLNGGGPGVVNHEFTTNRERANQHPINAIAGLQQALDTINQILSNSNTSIEDLAHSQSALADTISTLDNRLVNLEVAFVTNGIFEAGDDGYLLLRNRQNVFIDNLPSDVDTVLILQEPEAAMVNETVLHFSTGSSLPNLVYSNFTPRWLNGKDIELHPDTQYTVVFEAINGIVKASWGAYS